MFRCFFKKKESDEVGCEAKNKGIDIEVKDSVEKLFNLRRLAQDVLIAELQINDLPLDAVVGGDGSAIAIGNYSTYSKMSVRDIIEKGRLEHKNKLFLYSADRPTIEIPFGGCYRKSAIRINGKMEWKLVFPPKLKKVSTESWQGGAIDGVKVRFLCVGDFADSQKNLKKMFRNIINTKIGELFNKDIPEGDENDFGEILEKQFKKMFGVAHLSVYGFVFKGCSCNTEYTWGGTHD